VLRGVEGKWGGHTEKLGVQRAEKRRDRKVDQAQNRTPDAASSTCDKIRFSAEVTWKQMGDGEQREKREFIGGSGKRETGDKDVCGMVEKGENESEGFLWLRCGGDLSEEK